MCCLTKAAAKLYISYWAALPLKINRIEYKDILSLVLYPYITEQNKFYNSIPD